MSGLVRCNTVQEQSGGTWASSTVGGSVKMLATAPTANVNFTGWSLPAGVGDHFNNTVGDSPRCAGTCR